MPEQKHTAQRLKLDTPLHKCLSIVASDLYKTDKAHGVAYRINPKAANILLRAVAPDASKGMNMLRTLDRLNIYGWRVVGIYADLCGKDIELFKYYVITESAQMKTLPIR